MSSEHTPTASRSSLIVRVSSHTCALPLSEVVETMRPLAVAPVTDAPPFVIGLAIIRGAPVPVVDLGAMVAPGGASEIGRFVVVKVRERTVALAVSAVVGVRELDAGSIGEMPPLLRDCAAGVLAEVATLDCDLLFVLQAGLVLPESAP
jgi:purine-binding chemotaxis protein CheW